MTQLPRAKKVDKCVEHFRSRNKKKSVGRRVCERLEDRRGLQMNAHVKEASLVTARVCAKRRKRSWFGRENEMMCKTKMGDEEETTAR